MNKKAMFNFLIEVDNELPVIMATDEIGTSFHEFESYAIEKVNGYPVLVLYPEKRFINLDDENEE